MRKLFIVLLAILLLTACTPEGDIDWGSGTQEDSEETGKWSLDDFQPGAESIVYYTGFATEVNTLMASSYTDYFANEEDRTYSQDYTFDAVRVYYGNTSIFYLTYLHGSVSLEYFKETEEISSGDSLTKEISDSAQDSATLTTPLKMGEIDVDGEAYFNIQPKFQSFSNTCVMRTTYGDGTSETSETSSCDYEGLDIGGGSDEQCQPTTGDDALSNAGSCKLYVSVDGTISGSFTDSIYSSEDTSNSNQIRTISWALTPNTVVEE